MNKLSNAKLVTLTKIFSFLPSTVSNIQKETKLTYSHILRVVRVLEEENLITIKKMGRCLDIKMTERGKKVKNHLKEIDSVLNQ